MTSQITCYHFTISQIKYAILQARRDKFGDPKVKLDELKQWFQENKDLPENEDTPFIAVSKVETVTSAPDPQKYVPDKITFNCFITTKRLIGNAADKEILHADATYKLNFRGYPLLVFGTTDAQRAFHIIGLGISYGETADEYAFCFKAIKDLTFRVLGKEIGFDILVSDAAAAIQNGFEEVFPGRDKVSCYFHLKKRVEGYDKFKSKGNKESIISDIEKLQLSPSAGAFQHAVHLFITKWKRKEKDFTEYFERTWVKRNSAWFEGIRHFTPSTNNALECFNGRIKRDFDFCGRPAFNEFKVKVMELLRIVSCEYKDNIRSFATEPKIDRGTWLKALHWAKSKKNCIVKAHPNDDGSVYYIPGKRQEKVTASDVNKYLKGDNFDVYVKNMFSIWKVWISDNKEITCTCRKFFKLYTCKHALGLGLRLKLVTLPEAISCVEENADKRKRGRPQKARSALQRM